MRLIDADAFIAKLNHVPMVQEAIRKAMDTMPTIEERKGKWIQDPKSKRYRCDQCLSAALKTDDGQENLSDFCPACGADMREQP